MKEVIKHGKYKRIAECPTCGCTFYYDHVGVWSDISENMEGHKIVYCPDCQSEVEIIV